MTIKKSLLEDRGEGLDTLIFTISFPWPLLTFLIFILTLLGWSEGSKDFHLILGAFAIFIAVGWFRYLGLRSYVMPAVMFFLALANFFQSKFYIAL